MKGNVERERGTEGAKEHFRLRWSENAEHGIPSTSRPANRSGRHHVAHRSYGPVIEQSLAGPGRLGGKGNRSGRDDIRLPDGKVTLRPGAAERGGIQPVVSVTANGAQRAEVGVGDMP